MAVYTFPIEGLRPVLAVVAAHGATDLDSLRCLPQYAIWLLLPLPGVVVTAAFLAMSVLHFACDVGPACSIVLHAGVGLMQLRAQPAEAFQLMLAYLFLVHTPMHYARCVRAGQRRGLLVAAATTVAMLMWPERLIGKNVFVMGHLAQRIVLAHVIHELTSARMR